MRLIDADALLEHVFRDKLDTRELIAKMIENSPTVKQTKTCYKMCDRWKDKKYMGIYYGRFIPCKCGCRQRELIEGYADGEKMIFLECTACKYCAAGRTYEEAAQSWNKEMGCYNDV